MKTLVYKSDAGCRKGCHPVYSRRPFRGKTIEVHSFSVDEPGAWWDDEWNCHVDGMDFPCKSRDEAIKIGAGNYGVEEYEIIYEV